MTPTQEASLLAALQEVRISSGVVTMGLKTISTGMLASALRARAMVSALAATCFRVSGP
jgi:hypothetical protein